MEDFEITIYQSEGMFHASTKKRGVSGSFSLGSYSSEEKAQKLARIRLSAFIDKQNSDFIRWSSRKIELPTEVKEVLQKSYNFIYRGACLHSNKERVELQEKIKETLFKFTE